MDYIPVLSCCCCGWGLQDCGAFGGNLWLVTDFVFTGIGVLYSILIKVE